MRQPGHIFPLMAQPGGVLTRAGHTEAGCDLARLAGFSPAAMIVEILNDLGYAALEAADGPAGLEFLQSKRRIDLLITDIGLPGLNGRQVADAGRALRPELNVLFMTGYAENAAIASGFLEPGMEMITKPFAMETLMARIRKFFED